MKLINFLLKQVLLTSLVINSFLVKSQSGVDEISPMAIINVGLLGCDTTGVQTLKNFLSFGEFRCVALCGEDIGLSARLAKEVSGIQSKEPVLYTDYKEMLNRRDLDVVILATPDERQYLQFIDACRMGKNIYLEISGCKPKQEVNKMISAVKENDCIVQVGQQKTLGTRDSRQRIKNFLTCLSFQDMNTLYPIEKAACTENMVP